MKMSSWIRRLADTWPPSTSDRCSPETVAGVFAGEKQHTRRGDVPSVARPRLAGIARF